MVVKMADEMTTTDWLEELVAQIEEHGADLVSLQHGDPNRPLDITDVRLEDGIIKVTLE
jgi:hypothetical protein